MIRASVLALALALLLFPSGAQRPHAVQIGYCGGMNEIDQVKKAGFDYIELHAAEIAALPDADFEKLREKLKSAGIPSPAANVFIPASVRLTGPNVNKEQEMAYVRKALDRASELGMTTVVFGSGSARQVPDGFPKEEAFAQLIDFCKRLAVEARARKIIIAIEPLRYEESNIINSMTEGLRLVDAVHDPNIQLNLDYYHLEMVKEDPAIILKAASHIAHVHMANPTGRVFPLRWDEYNYGPFFENLRKIGYDKEMSIEASSKDFATEAPEAIAFLRGAMAGAH